MKLTRTSGSDLHLDAEAAVPLQPGNIAIGTPARATIRSASSAQGSLANLLPVLEDNEDETNQSQGGRTLVSQEPPGSPRARSMSGTSFEQLESDLEDGGHEFETLGDKSVRTPGDIRLAVLEWMYEEKDEDTCPDLVLSNAPVLEDLISVFVSVVLHGKSDIIRAFVWRFLVQASVHSVHFAFLVICNLNASCHQAADIDEDLMSLEYKQKRTKDLVAIEHVMDTIKKESLRHVGELRKPLEGDAESQPVLQELRHTLTKALDQLEVVHDNQVLTNLDLNVRGRTARQNIYLLVQKVRAAIVRGHTAASEEALQELDGRLGFIKTLTDLDDWLMRAVEREDRARILQEKLHSLAVALPLGAYLPTAVDRATQSHRVLRIVLEETIVFNTARKCPFLLVAEVEPVILSREDSAKSFDYSPNPSGKRPVALEALEMVATKNFWKNPMKEIRSLKSKNDHDNVPLGYRSADNLYSLDVEERALAHGSETEDNFSVTDVDDEHEQCYGHEHDGHEKGRKGGKRAGDAALYTKPQQERWEDMQSRIRSESPFGDRPNWQLASMFVKSGDDLRQQQLGVLFVSTFQKIFLEEGVPVWLSPYKVIATGRTCGLLEPARNADSIARIKERGGYNGIDEYFVDNFGNKTTRAYQRAQRNFMQSLAGYSIVAYLIKLHDRHNGNILVDTEGHLLHIDFGFMLGYSHQLERSPFKLTPDMIEVLGGAYSPVFQKFRRLMEKAFIAANKHHRELILLAELMSVNESSSECFAGGRRWVIDEFRARFCPGLTTRKLRLHINNIIDHSISNYTTRCYDKYQRCVNGIW